MIYTLNYNNFVLSEKLLDIQIDDTSDSDFIDDYFLNRNYLLEFSKTNYFNEEESEYLQNFLLEYDDEYLNEYELESLYGKDEYLTEGFKNLLNKTGHAFAKTGKFVGHGIAHGSKAVGRGTVVAAKGIGHGVAKGTIIAGKGIGHTTVVAAKGIHKGASIVGKGVAKGTVAVAKSTSKVAKTVGNKVVQAAKAIKFLVTTILKEFDKAYLFFTKGSKRDVQVSAVWTLKKYPVVKKQASKATGDEKEYFESVIKFLSKDIFGKIKNIFKSAVNKGVHESVIFDEDGYLLVSEVLEYLNENKAINLINKAHNFVGKDDMDMKLPDGVIPKIKNIVEKALDTIDSIMDTIWNARTRATLAGFAKGISMIGGPKPPDGGFKHTSIVYTYSGIHTHGGALGGGMMKNWKHTLGFGVRQAVGKAVDATTAIASHSVGILGMGIPYLFKLIKIIKKIQVTSLILKISAGDEKAIKVNLKDDSFTKKDVE